MTAPARRLRDALAVTALAAGLTVLMAAPVLRAPDERLFGREIVGRHYAPFVVIQQFEGAGARGVYLQPATDYPGMVLARALGSGLRAFQVMVLATFPLAACFAYLLTLHLTASRAAAWLAALVYAFLPYHVAQAAYHPHGAQTQWLPLYLLALFSCLERPAPPRLLLLVAATALVTLSNFYYGLMAAVLTPVAFLGYWTVSRRRDRQRADRAAWKTGGALAALVAAGLLYLITRAPQVLDSPARLAFPRRDLVPFSARWWSYWLPPVDHPLGGELATGVWRAHGLGGLLEQQITVGAGLTLLAAVAVFAWLRGERSGATRHVPVLAAIAAAAFALSLRPDWRLGPVAFPGPSGWLYELLPMFRAYARFGLAVALAVAVLAGIGFTILRRRSPASRLAGVGLLVLTAVELTPVPPWRWRDVLPTTAHRWLATHAERSRLFDCLRPNEAGLTAASAGFPGSITYRRGFVDCGDPQIAAVLGYRGFTHVLVRRDRDLGRWLARRPAPAGLDRVGDFEDALLYAVTGEPPAIFAEIGPGFFYREFKGERTFRWMTDRGHLDVFSRTDDPAARELELTLHAFPGPRVVEVLLDERPIAELAVSTEPAAYRVALPGLTPGRHRLELRTRRPAVVPDEVLANGDRRALAVALWGWRWTRPPG